jgi:hypothetical protein
MEILISFTTTVGVVEALRTTKDVAVDVVNQSIVMYLKNKKYPKTGGGNINNRDKNKKYPPFPSIPGLRALVSSTSESESETYKLDVYLSNRESSISGYFFYAYGAEINSKTIRKNGIETIEGTINTTGELGDPNLNWSYFVPYGRYEGGGSSGSFKQVNSSPTTTGANITQSQYTSSYEGKSSSGSSETFSETSGTTSIFGKPSIQRTQSFSSFSATVIFVE